MNGLLILRSLKEDIAQRHPKGATLKQVENFCNESSLLIRGSKLRGEFIEYIHNAGE